MDSRALGQTVQELRQHKGLTQDDLSDRAGLAYSTLAKIERGAIKNPSVFTIQALAQVLGVSIEEVLGLKAPDVAAANVPGPSQIAFIYCDINGTLVRFFQRAFTKLATDLDVSLEKVESSFWHFNDALTRGSMTLDQYQKTWALALGTKQPIDWQKYYLEAIEPVQPMHDWLIKASATFPVGLMSNNFPGGVEAMIKHGLVPDLPYRAMIDSAKLGYLKPEAAIYETAEAQAGVKPGQILLIDDVPANLGVAEQRGWHVFWFDDYRPEDSINRLNTVLKTAA